MRPSRSGFSLVEMLVVIVIVSILITLTLPSADSAIRGNALTQSGQMVADQIAAARQAAIARNRVVFVRFYKLPRELDKTGAFCAVQMLAQDDSGTIKPLAKIGKLHENVLISDSSQYSTIIADPTVSGSEDILGKTASYVGFRFYPDGSTDLDLTSNDGWFLTLMNRGADTSGGVPPDFYTVRVDAHTGRIRTFRP